MSTPDLGQDAPDFSLQDTHGNAVQLSQFRGTKVVLYFYPKDDTPGCTLEGQQFSGLLDRFKERNAVVYGISQDSVESHAAFAEKCSLAVPLLSDPDGSICEAYGVLENGKLNRTTFLIDEEGKVAHVWHQVKPQGHAEDVLLQVESAI